MKLERKKPKIVLYLIRIILTGGVKWISLDDVELHSILLFFSSSPSFTFLPSVTTQNNTKDISKTHTREIT